MEWNGKGKVINFSASPFPPDHKMDETKMFHQDTMNLT